MNKLLGKYKNGNYNVYIFEDGTKIRHNNENELIAAFPESIDMKISNRCDMGCPQCHERSTPYGRLANLNHPLLDSLHPYTELALGGGNVFEHPDLDSFLFRMSKQKIICNVTLHWRHFVEHMDDLQYYVDHGLIHGIGVSVNEPVGENFITYLKRFPNTVVHTIAGIMPWHGYMSLANHNLKLLILGYKVYGRGIMYFDNNSPSIIDEISLLKERLPYLFKHFPVLGPMMADVADHKAFLNKKKSKVQTEDEAFVQLKGVSLSDCLEMIHLMAITLTECRNFYTHKSPYNTPSQLASQYQHQEEIAKKLDKVVVASRRILKDREGLSINEVEFLTGIDHAVYPSFLI